MADQGVFLFTVPTVLAGLSCRYWSHEPFDVHLSFITGSLPANASLHEPSNRHHLLLFAPLQLTTWPIHINNDVY